MSEQKHKQKPTEEDIEYYSPRRVGNYFLVYLYMNTSEYIFAEWFDLKPLYFPEGSWFQLRRYSGLTEADLLAALIRGDLSSTELSR